MKRRGSKNLIKILGGLAVVGGAIFSAVADWVGKKEIKDEIKKELMEEMNTEREEEVEP